MGLKVGHWVEVEMGSLGLHRALWMNRSVPVADINVNRMSDYWNASGFVFLIRRTWTNPFFWIPLLFFQFVFYFLAFIFPLLGHIKFWVHCIPYGGHHKCNMAKDDCHYPRFWEGDPSKACTFSTECGTTLVDFHEPFCLLHPYDKNPSR